MVESVLDLNSPISIGNVAMIQIKKQVVAFKRQPIVHFVRMIILCLKLPYIDMNFN